MLIRSCRDGRSPRSLPLVLDDESSFWTIFSALPSAPRAGSLTWNTTWSKVLFSLSGWPWKRGLRAQLPLHVAARVAAHLVPQGPDVLDDVQRHGLVLEVLDLVLDDHLAVVEVAGDPLLLVLSMVRLTTTSWAVPT